MSYRKWSKLMKISVGLKKLNCLRVLKYLLLSAMLPTLVVNAQAENPGSKVMRLSEPGVYSGYSKVLYSEYVKSSQYVEVRDGTRLAVDIYRPAVNGVAVDKPHPVIWNNTRYHREWMAPYFKNTMELIKFGYVVAIADARGSGGSFGHRQGPWTQTEAQDMHDITEWFAAQPWSTDRVGMFGSSYMGISQYIAASATPSSLKAIIPVTPIFDWYNLGSPGGVYMTDMLTAWGFAATAMDTDPKQNSVPVDEDNDRSLLAQAREEHKQNRWTQDIYLPGMHRDAVDQVVGNCPWMANSPSNYTREIEASGVAIYHIGGWWDMGAKEVFVALNSLKNPQKLLMGPWSHFHPEIQGKFVATEHLRWYDYWLKGIDNGVVDEPPVYYNVMGAGEGDQQQWRFAGRWPLPGQSTIRYYFHAGNTGSISSKNDGFLKTKAPTGANDKDEYQVDYSTTWGSGNRWTHSYAYEVPFGYPDMAENGKKGLTYTTVPLAADTEITGHPVVHLWVSSTAADGDFFVTLEEVNPGGKSDYITEGVLRGSHRATVSKQPHDAMGIPYHPSTEKTAAPLSDEPVALVIDQLPTSNIFNKGNRIRITITGADKDTSKTPEVSPSPIVSVYRNKEYASYIDLPIIEH